MFVQAKFLPQFTFNPFFEILYILKLIHLKILNKTQKKSKK